MDALLNRTIRGYELHEKIGAGGFGAVYRAYQPNIGREVAIKVILPQHANQPEFIRRFEVEAQLVARLEHPHIVPLYDYWREPEGAYLVMRWLRTSLRKVLERGAWQIPEVARFLDQIAAALAIAHREGVIHRDIKPDNILLDEDNNAYLADFGIAKNLNIRETLSDDDGFVGSPAYVSPEQIRSDDLSARSDIYCLGLLIYELLTGEQPFPDATTVSDFIMKHLNAHLPLMNERHPNIPAALDEVIQTATAKDPNNRYPNAVRFAAAFRAAIPNLQRAPAQPLAEPLTERELEILQLMVDGCSNQDIAARLHLSESTVRWYLKQIYAKLDVHSRHQAVARARSLNIFNYTAVMQQSSVEIPELPTEIRVEPENPFKGLRAFQEADMGDFFGRAALTEQLLGHLAEGHQFLVVVGPSGSGKSSVVRAGLVPALRRGTLSKERHQPFIAEMMPGTHPLEELEAALLRVSVNPLTGIHEQLQEDRRGLVRAVKRVLPNDQNTELILLIDQFEELFTLVEDEATRVHFIDNLLAAVTDPRSRVRVILTLRADFYDRPLMYPRLAELVRSHTEVVIPMTSRELEQAITAPAERVGLIFENGLVDSILNDIGEQPGMLPLLQYTLTELFERRKGLALTLDAYKAVDGVAGSLARRADEIYASLDENQEAAARQLFLRLVTLGEGTEDTRRRTLQAEIAALHQEMEEVLTAFTQYRLLTFDRDPITRTPTVEIAHEALIREWQQLRQWVQDGREDMRMQRRLSASAAEWEHSKYDPSYLSTGSKLDQFRIWADETDLVLAPHERTYLEASIAEQTRLETLEAERKNRELTLAREAAQSAQKAAGAQKQAASRLRYLAGVLVVGILVAFGLSFFAFDQSQTAQAERDNAEEARAISDYNAEYARSIALASAARVALSTNNLDQAVAFAVAANMTTDQPPVFAQNALYDAAFLPATAELRELNADGGGFRFSPDERYVLESWDGLVILHDAITWEALTRFDPDPAAESKWSGDTIWFGKYAITTTFRMPDQDGRVVKFDPFEAAEILAYELEGESVFTLVVSPDERFLVGGTIQGNIYVWDIETGAQVRRFSENHPFIETLVFNADGETLWSGSDDGKAILWNFATGEPLQTLDIPGKPDAWVTQIIPSRLGLLTLWATRWENGLLIWDPETGEILQEPEIDTSISVIALSEDARTLVIARGNGELYLYDTETWQPVQQLYGHTRRIGYVRYLDDTRLMTASSDGTLRIWNLENHAVEQVLEGHTTAMNNFSISQDGQTALTASGEGAFVWNLETGVILQKLVLPDAALYSAALSVDGQQAILWSVPSESQSCNAFSRMVLYDTVTGELLVEFNTQAGDKIEWAAFHPDGRRIFTSATDCSNVIKIWDVDTGEQVGEWEAHPADQGTLRIISSPDGRWLVSGSFDHTAVLWDAETLERVRTFEHNDFVGAVAFSPDSQYLLTGDGDAFVHLWDVKTGQEIRRFSGHSIMIDFVTFSPDGRQALSSGKDNYVILWEIATGNVVRQFSTPQSGIISSMIGFSADGQSIYISDENNAIRRIALYLDPSELLNWVQTHRYIRDLTCDERQLYQVEPLCENQ